jgi:xanthine/uracil permease
MKFTLTNVIAAAVIAYVIYIMFFSRETFLTGAPPVVIGLGVAAIGLTLIYVVAGQLGYL